MVSPKLQETIQPMFPTAEFLPTFLLLLVLEYQKNIHSQLRTMSGFDRVTYKTIVPNHVGMWVLRRSGSANAWA